MERRIRTPDLEMLPPVAEVEKRKDTLDGVTFSGFTPDQEAQVREQILAIGLPLNNLNKVLYAPTPNNRPGVVGDYTLAGSDEGRLRLYKSLEKLPKVAQFSTIVHELGHQADVFDEKNDVMFGTAENREQAIVHVEAVAQQSLDTKRYLNGYHKLLAQQCKEGTITFKHFCQETHTILIELRFTNPKHLEQVQQAQLARGGKTRLITTPEATEVTGVDATLMTMLKDVKTYEELVAHIDAVKLAYHPDEAENPTGITTKPVLTFAPAFFQLAQAA